MDFTKGIREMLYYLLDRKQYRSVGYIGGLYEEETCASVTGDWRA